MVDMGVFTNQFMSPTCRVFETHNYGDMLATIYCYGYGFYVALNGDECFLSSMGYFNIVRFYMF